jgi:hypothetical protein
VSWLEFISQVLNALGWPAAAVGAALILRRPLATLIADPTLKSLKAGPFEAAWDRALAAVERSTADAIKAPEIEPSDASHDPSTPIRVIRRNYERMFRSSARLHSWQNPRSLLSPMTRTCLQQLLGKAA